ncbi:MAG: nucleotidyltransferase, partial [Catenibacterium mitsuokai]|nr:nucleotidyltransferase [Catenibacterium mitsuokai]
YIGELLRENKLSVKVLEVQDSWFGVTYKEDAPVVKESFKKLIDEGVYSTNLFDNIK